MPTIDGLQVHVEVAGAKAEDYKVDTTVRQDGVKETRCGIESVSGARFGARMSNDRTVHQNVCGVLFVDGVSVLMTATAMNANPHMLDYAVESGNVKVPLIFATMTPVAEGTVVDTADKTMAGDDNLEGIGQIKVEIWSGRETVQYGNTGGVARRQLVLNEKQKKAAHITHTTGFGAPIGQYQSPGTTFIKERLVHVFYFAYMNRDMLEVREYIPMPAITSTTLGASPSSTRAAAAVKPERGVAQVIDLSSGDGDTAANKRRRPNEGPARPTPVVYLDDSDDEEQSRAPRKLPVKPEPLSSVNSAVISLLSDDDE
ncbi:hypothetical protein H9P43_000843 [Blastocladiella emersonii ATCC 22665]|nr:hypothetical protein H9P43_000843 [Blastocladiella emersonii ATCC 22665]